MDIKSIIEKQDWSKKEAEDWYQLSKELILSSKDEKTRNSLIIVAEHCNNIIKNSEVK